MPNSQSQLRDVIVDMHQQRVITNTEVLFPSLCVVECL
jgi:hypothetical protein